MSEAITVLLQIATNDPDYRCSLKPMFVQCACGKWQVQFLFDDNSALYVPEVFDTKLAACEEMADRIAAEGVEVTYTTLN